MIECARISRLLVGALSLAFTATVGAAALAPADLPMRSGGQVADGGALTMEENGYVGTFVRLAEAGELVVTVEAQGTMAEGVTPVLRISVADEEVDVTLDGDADAFEHAFTLPAGTYFVRIAYINDGGSEQRSATLREIRIDGGEVLLEGTDALALEAADTYVEHFRKGLATVVLPGVEPGTKVHVALAQHAFNFGVNAPGWNNLYLQPDADPESDAGRYQMFILDHINMVVPSNAGKWAYHEATRDEVSMPGADGILAFADQHGLRARMHTLLWAAQQEPEWVYPLLDAAAAGDEAARRELREEISERIDYYVRDRAKQYVELDVLNESLHQPRYMKAYGVEGVADIYRDVADAVEAAGAETRLYVNEFNVLQWSSELDADGQEGERDPYANWYREHVEALRNAGAPVSGIGIQYYADGREDIGTNVHSAARILGVLENLAVTGLPLTLTEFEVRRASPERAAEMVEETFRLFFGSPHATSALIWAINPAGDNPPASILIDEQFQLTPVGERFVNLMDQWTTETTAIVGDDGAIAFDGFYGDYLVTAGDRTFAFSHEKGVEATEAREQ